VKPTWSCFRKGSRCRWTRRSPNTTRSGTSRRKSQTSPHAVPALIAALERGRPQTRATAAWALGELKAETARDALIRALDDPLGMVKQNAAAALTRLDQKRR
jgi:hypothetical protein